MTGLDGKGTAPIPEPAPTAEAGAAVLRGGTIPAVAVGAVGAGVCALWGWHAIAAFAVGAVLATGALAVAPLLLRASRTASPPAVTAMAIGGYAAVVVLLGVLFVVLGSLAWLSAEHLAAALVAVTVAGLAGQTRAVTRLRVPAFASPVPSPVDGPVNEGDRTSGRPADGDAAQSSQQATR
ncbi:MAG TPA: hypothetical protein VMT69_04870 [Kineosporiaceae bacterium]|nr:hypothetical protein [Kineosporiaceae bacterium]